MVIFGHVTGKLTLFGQHLTTTIGLIRLISLTWVYKTTIKVGLAEKMYFSQKNIKKDQKAPNEPLKVTNSSP